MSGGALRFLEAPSLSEPTLLLAFEGWNDAGEAASLALRHVAKAAGAAPLAEIDGEGFYDLTVRRPEVRHETDGRRRIEWPCNPFLAGSLGPGRDVVIGGGSEPHLHWRDFTDLVVEVAERVGARRVGLLGAYLADVVYSRPVAVTGFASEPGLGERLHLASSAYEGPTGIVGVLAERLEREGFQVLSLWAGLPHYVNLSPNPRGALALLQKLEEWTGFRTDREPLERQAAEFEEKVSAIVTADPELAEYVRQLKRREFAQ
jgi:proteasome assembly chaperone (PAC2) family protein